jgi:hypothetical protein
VTLRSVCPVQSPSDIFSKYEARLGNEPVSPETPKNGRIDFRAIFAGAIFAGGLVWAAHFEISKVDDRLITLDKHISRVETAVRIIGAKQGGDTKTLIDEALTAANRASSAGRAESAKSILDYANRLLKEQEALKTPAPQQFFDSALDSLQALGKSPALRESVYSGTVQLAEYRSALAERPSNLVVPLSGVQIGELRKNGSFLQLKDSFFFGPYALFSGLGRNAIDGMILDNVVFENMTITYHGGPLVLHNVRFINCRFEVPDSPSGNKLLVSAAKEAANIQIG